MPRPWLDPDDGSRECAHAATDAARAVDDSLAQRVAHSLGSSGAGCGRVYVTVQNQVVILCGNVDSEQTRSAIVRRAWSAGGVSDVCNRISIGNPDDVVQQDDPDE